MGATVAGSSFQGLQIPQAQLLSFQFVLKTLPSALERLDVYPVALHERVWLAPGSSPLRSSLGYESSQQKERCGDSTQASHPGKAGEAPKSCECLPN